MRIGCPAGFEPLDNVVDNARDLAVAGASIHITNDPYEAVSGANAVYTDVWASMGQEKEQGLRKNVFQEFCLNRTLLLEASPSAIVLHCLPAHRGEEISSEVMESSSSRIFDQAENRLHVQQALLAALLGGL